MFYFFESGYMLFRSGTLILLPAFHTRARMLSAGGSARGFCFQQVNRSAVGEKALGLISVSAYGCLCGLRLSIQHPANELTH